MKLRNKLIKQFATNETLRKKNDIYTNYKAPDVGKTCYVMTDSTDVIVCNADDIHKYESAGFTKFGFANDQLSLDKLIADAEMS